MAVTDGINSPEIFRKWGAIYSVASTLERKVWVRTLGSNLYPNIYVVFVAPPGVGKTEITFRVREMLTSLDGHKIASSSVTKASLMDELGDAKRAITRPLEDPPVMKFNSLAICSNELGVLLPAYDNELMNALTDIYDCKNYEERRRASKIKSIEIKNPQINMLAACTPSYLHATLPDGAWDQGFLSRVILVFSDERELRDLFAETASDNGEVSEVKKSLARLDEVVGKMSFTPDAASAMNNWYKSGNQPAPEHPKLQYYNVRRTVHALKLCMVASVSRSIDATIEKEDVIQAIDWLLEAEIYMPEIFKAINSGGTAALIEEAWHYVYKQYMTGNKEPVLETRIIQWLSMKAPANQAMLILDLMERGGLLKQGLTKNGKGFTPIKKQV